MKNDNKNNSLRFHGLRTSGMQIRKSIVNMKKILFIFIFYLSGNLLIAQNNHTFTAGGFLEYANTSWALPHLKQWSELSGAYTRINLDWYATSNFSLHAGIRNNFLFGSMMAGLYPYYEQMLTTDDGLMDLTFKLAGDSSSLLLSNTDRLYFKWTLNKFEITVGRQRINWGINMVWNPNDIFNTYNYFDFDYVERPGSDAVLLQYYTGNLSSIQVAAKLNKNKELTAAILYKFNLANYDFQVMGGVMQKDVVAGFGWAGQIGKAGFTGEASYFRNAKHFSDSTGQFVASVSANYTFKNGLFLNTSFIYNSKGTTGKAGLTNYFINGNLNPKTLTFSRFDVFAEVSYPVTPLIKVDASAMINPNDGSVFAGPSVDFSLTENLEFFLMGQLFFGDQGTEFGHYGKLIYARLKWSF